METNMSYARPEVEVLEVNVEGGFALSGGEGTGDYGEGGPLRTPFGF